MANVLVLEPSPLQRDAWGRALTNAGHAIDARERAPHASEIESRVDAIVVDLDLAVTAGYFATAPKCPLVVTTRFQGFVEAARRIAREVILTPASDETIVAAVSRAAGTPSLTALADEPTQRAADATAPANPRAERSPWFEIDPASTNELDAIAATIARATGAPSVQISLVGERRQQYLGLFGMPPDLVEEHGVRSDQSICQHVVTAGVPFRVRDAKAHPALAAIPYVELGFVRAYAGVPVRVGDSCVGTVCATGPEPSDLDERALAALELGARLASTLIESRGRAVPQPALPKPGSLGVCVGDVLEGKYWVTARLGEGGQAEVLLARDRLLGHLVAIKAVHEQGSDEATLLAEAAILASLRHPGIVRLNGWGRSTSGKLFLVLDYLEGVSLSKRLAQRVDVPEAKRILREIAEALDALHAKGLLHGDIKPANIILDAALGRAVLFDFGLVLHAGRVPQTPGGTPGFSAPEQFSGEVALDARVDVYALAVLAYVLLTRQRPFEGAPELRLVMQQAGTFTPPSRHVPELSEAVDRWISAAMSPDPSQRPASAREFVDGLERSI